MSCYKLFHSLCYLHFNSPNANFINFINYLLLGTATIKFVLYLATMHFLLMLSLNVKFFLKFTISTKTLIIMPCSTHVSLEREFWLMNDLSVSGYLPTPKRFVNYTLKEIQFMTEHNINFQCLLLSDRRALTLCKIIWMKALVALNRQMKTWTDM